MANPITGGQVTPGATSSTGIIPNNGAPAQLMPAAQQSQLLETLQARLAATSTVGKAISDASPKVTLPGVAPTATSSGQNIVPEHNEGPIKVSSLAIGIKAKGLHDLLLGGEGLILAKGNSIKRFRSSIRACRVAPNNPLALLGRAHAELAGGYYAQAEIDLRKLFGSDPELLMAQFDLSAVLPKDRAAFVRKDLKELMTSDPKAERPWFLLAYLDYNTGDPAAADKDLAEAETRSGSGTIWSVRLLRAHWTLPTNGKAAPSPWASRT